MEILLHFMAPWLDLDQRVLFSKVKSVKVGVEAEIAFSEKDLSPLYTPVNSTELLSQ